MEIYRIIGISEEDYNTAGSSQSATNWDGQNLAPGWDGWLLIRNGWAGG